MRNTDNLIFAPCSILLPPYTAEERDEWSRFAVIACDQHTSDRAYWKKCEEITEGYPSAYDMILPEAYLGTEDEANHKNRISRAQNTMNSGWLRSYKHSMIYVERTLSNGKIRRGIVGKIDLEHYDFSHDSVSAVRPTEGTVPERVEPRVEIRRGASFELPHVMVFMNDRGFDITAECAARKDRMKKLYDFDLMLGGGHITGYLMTGDVLDEMLDIIADFERAKAESGEIAYGVGDGNHSLAAAATIYRRSKEKNGALAMSARSRYAAVEMVSVNDEAIEFEPIYRLVENTDPTEFTSALKKYADGKEGAPRTVKIITAQGEETLALPVAKNSLTVGLIQEFLDAYTKAAPEVSVDYIHGEEELVELGKKQRAVGILFDGMEKEELFPYISANGPLPRKTFSMGAADTKRYYLEVRRISE